MLKKFKKTNKQEDFLQLKQLRARSKYLIKTSKKTSWEKFTSSINEKTDTKSVWNKIQSLNGIRRNQKINLLAINSTQLVNSNDQIANDLGQYFYNNSSEQQLQP